MSPSELYCCNEYRELLEMMLNKENAQNDDIMIDITPHAPYGSKQDRKASKEHAARK